MCHACGIHTILKHWKTQIKKKKKKKKDGTNGDDPCMRITTIRNNIQYNIVNQLPHKWRKIKADLFIVRCLSKS